MNLDWPLAHQPPPLAAMAVHVWATELADVPLGPSERALLSAAENSRADQFLLDAPRRQFVASRVMLRTLLAGYLQRLPAALDIVLAAHGKPALRGEALQFNLAHSGDMALLAIARSNAVGVDLEQLRVVEHAEQIAARNFHAMELAALRAAAPTAQETLFHRIWTRKEAALKAVGAGLGYPLDQFDVLAGDHGVELPPSDERSPIRCYLRDLAPAAGYAAALATTRAVSELHTFHWRPQS